VERRVIMCKEDKRCSECVEMKLCYSDSDTGLPIMIHCRADNGKIKPANQYCSLVKK